MAPKCCPNLSASEGCYCSSHLKNSLILIEEWKPTLSSWYVTISSIVLGTKDINISLSSKLASSWARSRKRSLLSNQRFKDGVKNLSDWTTDLQCDCDVVEVEAEERQRVNDYQDENDVGIVEESALDTVTDIIEGIVEVVYGVDVSCWQFKQGVFLIPILTHPGDSAFSCILNLIHPS